MKKIIFASALFCTFIFTLTAQGTFQLKNKLTGTYLNTEGGKLQASVISTHQRSAQWQFVDAGTAQFRIKNLGDGTFLNIENGFACTAIADNWWSAIWKVRIVEDSNFIEINNLWQPNRYINMENGLGCTEITNNPQSAKWEYEEVDNGIVYKDAGGSQQFALGAQNPVIIPVTSNDGVVAFAFKQKGESGSHVMIYCYKKQGEQCKKLWTKVLPNSLDNLGGFTTDGTNYYCLTTKQEAADATVNGFRDGIVRLVKIDEKGNEIWTKEINHNSYLTVPVYNPLTFGTGGLAYGNGRVAIVFAKNTEYDEKNKVRHQSAVMLIVNASTGEAKQPCGDGWFGHSFDQRIIFDGQDFVFVQLGDGFPAEISLRKSTDTPEPFQAYFQHYWTRGAYVYGRQGIGNATFTSLGNIHAGSNGYTVLFSSEGKNDITGRDMWSAPWDPRNVGLVHVVKNFETMTDSLDKHELVSNLQILGNDKTMFHTSSIIDTKTANPLALDSYTFKDHNNPKHSYQQAGLVWLTNYRGNTNFTSTERPKLVALNNNQYVALWEEWIFTDINDHNPKFSATKCILADAYGNILKPASLVPARLNPSGADLPFVLNGKAAWITREEVAEPFNAHTGVWEFNLHTVDSDLETKNYTLPQ